MTGAIPGIISCCREKKSVDNTLSVRKPVLMKVGCQWGDISVENLEFRARHGVYNIDGGSPKMIEGVGWDLEDSLAKRELCEKYGISLDAYHLPLTSVGIEKVDSPILCWEKALNETGR